jgi:hypothetical protein
MVNLTDIRMSSGAIDLAIEIDTSEVLITDFSLQMES